LHFFFQELENIISLYKPLRFARIKSSAFFAKEQDETFQSSLDS